MKRKFEVRWYECNLTIEKKRKFFTKIGASLFAGYLQRCEMLDTKVYEL